MDWQRFIPGFWSQNATTSLEWDKALNAALDEHGVTYADRHHARIGGFYVWVANWPYAYGSLDGCDALPKVATRKRLRKAILTHKINSAGKSHA